MSDWSQGYIVDLPYTHGFYREQAPASLNLALLLKGFRAPLIDRPFRYLELGCGQGVTANLLAAANANGEFWAVDFNPTHIAGARYTAQAGDISNVTFFERSFEQFLSLDTPEFDYITLHGIYSWVSPETQRAIIEIISRKLCPGGVVYASYNALPGWAAAMPLRQLFIELDSGHPNGSEQRMDRSIEFASKLQEAKAGYFTQNPQVGPRLARLKDLPRSYLIHEYLNEHWRPFYFTEISEQFAAAKLTFAASAHVGDHIDALALPKEALALLAAISDVNRHELARDFIVNQQFRRDVFLRGPISLTPQERLTKLSTQRFALMAPKDELKLEVTFPIGKCRLRPEIYEPIVDMLSREPASLVGLVQGLSGGGLDSGGILQALLVLTSMGTVVPAVSTAEENQRQAAAQKYNASTLANGMNGPDTLYLASPVTGSAVPVNRLDALFLLAQRAGASPVDYAWRILGPRGVKFTREGKQVETEEENLAMLAEKAASFSAGRFALFRGLGIA